MSYHGDENTPHIHMPYIPYVRNMKRGVATQNSFTKAFEKIGYTTIQEQAVDKDGNLVWQLDKMGHRVPQMKRKSFGGVDWVEEQKEVLAKMMKERYGWEREYKGSSPRGNLLLSDYRREKAAERAKEAEQKQKELETQVEKLKSRYDEIGKDIYDSEKHLEDLNDKEKTTQEKIARAEHKADEVEKKAMIAEVLNLKLQRYGMEEKEYLMREEIIDLSYENESLKQENKELKEKLKQAYDYMKQFVIKGKNMLEDFLEKTEKVIERVMGRGR